MHQKCGKGDFKMYDLSVCLAAIRKENWPRLYNSIVESVKDYSFELIFCGPHENLPDELKDLNNVSCIQDFGPPTRCQQISMLGAVGRYITWAADDGWFLPNKLFDCIEFLDSQEEEKKCVVTQYIEGGVHALGDPKSGMYCMNFHDAIRSPFYPNHFLIFNSVVLPTQYFKDLGGFDCKYEVCPMAHADFGARAQLDGIKTTLADVVFECTQFPGTSGDHAPVHYAQLEHDQPLYAKIWRSPECRNRIKIDINNWKQAPEVWTRRFGDL